MARRRRFSPATGDRAGWGAPASACSTSRSSRSGRTPAWPTTITSWTPASASVPTSSTSCVTIPIRTGRPTRSRHWSNAPGSTRFVRPWRPCPTSGSTAWSRRAASPSGRKEGGVLLDALHLQRCGNTVEDVRGLHPALLTYLQIADAPRRAHHCGPGRRTSSRGRSSAVTPPSGKASRPGKCRGRGSSTCPRCWRPFPPSCPSASKPPTSPTCGRGDTRSSAAVSTTQHAPCWTHVPRCRAVNRADPNPNAAKGPSAASSGAPSWARWRRSLRRPGRNPVPAPTPADRSRRC